jgi:hypothetical protein
VNKMVLPAFLMDCRDWLVVDPRIVGLPDAVADSPLLAVLSTALVDDGELRSASGVLTVGLLDGSALAVRPVAEAAVAAELVEGDSDSVMRFVLPAPHGQLALLAEFTVGRARNPDVVERVEALMASFRWADPA